MFGEELPRRERIKAVYEAGSYATISVQLFPMKATWSDILLKLRQNLPEGVCKVWLEPLAGEVRDGLLPSAGSADLTVSGEGSSQVLQLCLTAPNSFVAGYVRDRLSQAITQAASDLYSCPISLCISASYDASGVTGSSSGEQTRPQLPKPLTPETLALTLPSAPAVLASTSQLTLPLSLPRHSRPFAMPGWKHSFEDFVVGPCNQLAHAAACNMLQTSMPVDMLFLCSDPGLGKTHLTQAVGQALGLEANKSNVQMEYLTAEEFTSLFVQASKFGAMEQFKERFRRLDMLMLEDVHFLRGKDKTQEELLSTIKSLQSRGGRVVLTSSFAPRDLAGVDSQLVSRFCSGFVASIERPNKDMRLHILMEKARRQSIILPAPVADMLADRITNDVRMLESCLHNLVLKSRLMGRPLSEDMALDIIHSVAQRSDGLSLDLVLKMVCQSFNLTPTQLSSKSRRQDLVLARNTAFFLLRKHTDLTLEQIGDRFNRRHSTVLKGITSMEREMSRQSPTGRQLTHTVSLIEKQARV